MRQALAFTPLSATRSQSPAAPFSLLETIASAEERSLIERQRMQAEAVVRARAGQHSAQNSGSRSGAWLSRMSRVFAPLAQLPGHVGSLLMRTGIRIHTKSSARQMRILEQLSVGRNVTLVLVEIAGSRLLLTLPQGAAATVTPLAAESLCAAATTEERGPQSLDAPGMQEGRPWSYWH